jgi:very-short-patch-repair endonuclease
LTPFFLKSVLVIEVDGDFHLHQQDYPLYCEGYDHQRVQDLQSHDLCVMRFSNAEVTPSTAGVIQNIDGVPSVLRELLAEILRTCSTAPHKKQDQEEE